MLQVRWAEAKKENVNLEQVSKTDLYVYHRNSSFDPIG